MSRETTERTCECRQPDCHACELAGVKGWLEAQGLHVVTAADKAVLKAGNLVLDSSLRRIADENGGCLADWARAELARRGLT